MSAQQPAAQNRPYRLTALILCLLIAPIAVGPMASGATNEIAAASAALAQERLPDEEAELQPRERQVIPAAVAGRRVALAWRKGRCPDR